VRKKKREWQKGAQESRKAEAEGKKTTGFLAASRKEKREPAVLTGGHEGNEG